MLQHGWAIGDYAKWNKPDTERQILCVGSTKKIKCIEVESRKVVTGARGVREKGRICQRLQSCSL